VDMGVDVEAAVVVVMGEETCYTLGGQDTAPSEVAAHESKAQARHPPRRVDTSEDEGGEGGIGMTLHTRARVRRGGRWGGEAGRRPARRASSELLAMPARPWHLVAERGFGSSSTTTKVADSRRIPALE